MVAPPLTVPDTTQRCATSKLWNLTLVCLSAGIGWDEMVAMWSKGISYDAKQCYQRAIKLDSNFALAWFNLGLCGGGKVDGIFYNSKNCYEQAVSIDPNNAVAWLHLGACGGLSQGKHDVTNVTSCYTKALELDSNLSVAWQMLGSCGGGKVNGVSYAAHECYSNASRTGNPYSNQPNQGCRVS